MQRRAFLSSTLAVAGAVSAASGEGTNDLWKTTGRL
jgi:hypothetical protein